MAYANGEVADYDGTKVAVICARRGEIRAYIGNRRLEDSRTKKEALKRISEAMEEQGRLF